MKTREGFVSNSSSTSFCIMGVSAPDGTDSWELSEKLGEDLRVENACNEYDESVYVGLWPNDIKDEETLSEFKKRIRKSLKANGLGEGEALGWITDGGYNG